MSEGVLEVIETRLLRPYKYPKLVHNGYLYNFQKSCVNHLRWKCNRVYSMKCPVVLRTNMDRQNLEFIAVDHEHVHEPDTATISELRSKVKIHQESPMYQNNTMFKPREGYFNIRIDQQLISKNNTRYKLKNGYGKINTGEEDIPEDIKNNKLARFCASMNQIYLIDPLDPDYERRYTDECKKKKGRRKKNLNKINFNLEYSNIRITRNTAKQKQIEFNNSKNDITENTISCSPFNDKIKTFDQIHGEILKEQNLIVSEKKENNGQTNESTLLTNVDKEKNNLPTNTSKIINNKTINTPKENNSSISNTNKDNNTLANNTHEEINTLINNTDPCKEKKSLIININKNKNTLTSNINKTKYLLSRHKIKKKNTLTTNTNKKKSSLINNLNKKKYVLTRNNYKNKNSPTTDTHKKKNIITTDKQKTKKSLTTNDSRKMISSESKNNNLKPTNHNALEIKNTSVIITPTIKNTSTNHNALEMKNTSTILSPEIKNCMNKAIDNKDDLIISNDNDSYYNDTDHHDEELNDITIDVNEDLISIYRKENWPTILNKLSDPLTGIEVFKSILFYKAYDHAMREFSKTKSNIQKIKDRSLKWKKKYECLAFEMKALLECTKSVGNTSIQHQNQKDTTLYKNIVVGEKENKVEVQKIVSTNSITSENFKTSKLYQQSLNSENKNLTECDTDINKTTSKEIEMNIVSTPPVMADLIKDIPSSSTVSILNPESLKNQKRNLTESDTCITRPEAKILKTNYSSIPSFDHLDPPDTTFSRINLNSFYSKQNNLTRSDSVIKMTPSKTNESNLPYTPLLNIPKPSRVSPETLDSQKSNLIQSDTSIELSTFLINEFNEPASTEYIDLSVDSQDMAASRLSPNFTQHNTDIEMTKSKCVESNEHSTSVSKNVSPNTPILTENDTEFEICEVTQSDMIDYYKSFKSDSIDSTGNYEPDITTLGLSSYTSSNQETVSTQYNTNIMNTKSQLMESTPAYIDLTVESPPDLTAPSVSQNVFDGQSCLTQQNTKIECYEPSTAASFALTVNNPPVMMNSRFNNENNIFTEYDEDIKIISSTSMSTNLSSYIQTFSSSSSRETSPLNHNPDLNMLDHPRYDVLVVEKNAELSTLNTSKTRHLDWKSPNSLLVMPNKVPVMNSRDRAILPIAIKRLKGLKPNVDTSSEYPLLNKLLTQQINKIKTPILSVINQMKILKHLEPTNTTVELDQRNIFNTPVIPINNRMKAPLPDVVYESTQITKERNYQETIQSNYSYNLFKVPHNIKPVPIAIPIPPSEMIYVYSDEV